MPISAADPFERKRVETLDGLSMATIDQGEGDPIVFLHGNPTSSYLWRNIIPHVQDLGRCIAPDLIGMGQSDKLPDNGPERYRFVEHRRFLDDLLAKLGVTDNVTLVIHDWGSGLGFDWARRHADAVKAICYMEALVMPSDDWSHFPPISRKFFQAMRSAAGEGMIIDKNLFVERVLPSSVKRPLTDEEMAVYRAPFVDPPTRRPTLTWPRQIPVANEPEDVFAIAGDYAAWMASNELPKLFVNAEPGAILTGPARDFCRTWKNQTEVTVEGIHFVQEDSPDAIGGALRKWLLGLGVEARA